MSQQHALCWWTQVNFIKPLSLAVWKQHILVIPVTIITRSFIAITLLVIKVCETEQFSIILNS